MPTNENEMNGSKIALITGANRGLGRETARQLGALGYHVLVAARRGDKAEAAVGELRAAGIKATALELDVDDPRSIRAAAARVEREVPRLDALVNNAGVVLDGFSTPVSEVDAEVILKTFHTNTLGALQVTQVFLPLLKKSPAARIVNVSSGMGQLTGMNGGATAYRISKTAMNVLTRTFADELQGTAIKINSVCPGWVRTELGGPEAPRSVEEGASGIVWAAILTNDGPTGGFFRDGKHLDW